MSYVVLSRDMSFSINVAHAALTLWSCLFSDKFTVPINMPRLCSNCHKKLPRTAFSTTQWKRNASNRRCSRCIDDNIDDRRENANVNTDYKDVATRLLDQPVLTVPNTSMNTMNQCYICQEGPDNVAGGLVRDCACRGSCGFAHVQCLIDYAYSTAASDPARGLDHNERFDWFRGVFMKCGLCKQRYEGDVRRVMTGAMIPFLRQNYLENKDWFCHEYKERHILIFAKNEYFSSLEDTSDVAKPVLKTIAQLLLSEIKVVVGMETNDYWLTFILQVQVSVSQCLAELLPELNPEKNASHRNLLQHPWDTPFSCRTWLRVSCKT